MEAIFVFVVQGIGSLNVQQIKMRLILQNDVNKSRKTVKIVIF